MLHQTWECTYLFELVFLFSLDKYTEVELLIHIVVLFLIFWETCTMLSIVAAPIYLPTNSEQGFPFCHILTNTCYFLSFWYYNSHSDRYEVIFHCGFDLHFPDDWWCWVSFHVPVGQLDVFFGKCLFRSSAHFLIGLSFVFCFLFAFELYGFFIYLDISPLTVTWFENIFLPFGRLPFHFVDGFFWYAKAF